MDRDLLPLSKKAIEKLFTGDQTPFKLPSRAERTGQDCSAVSEVSTLTSMDLVNSMIYARHRILKDKCIALKSSGAGVDWQNIIPDGTVPYTCPPSLMTGANGSATGTCAYGHCAFTSQDECLKYSKVPFDSNGDMLPENKNNFYMEWRAKTGAPPGTMGCYLGNYAFRRWCEIPKSRDPDHPDTDDKDKLIYTPNGVDGGTCSLDRAYCHHKNEQWDDDSKSCYKTDGQKFFEALFGNTIDAFFTGSCGPGVDDSSSGLKARPQRFNKLSDRRLKERMVKLADDYGGKGVHLYLYFYSEKALKLHPGYKKMQLGFLADEVEKVHPDIVIEKDGYKYISFTLDQLRERRYWRIINTIKNEHTILKGLMDRYLLQPVKIDV